MRLASKAKAALVPLARRPRGLAQSPAAARRALQIAESPRLLLIASPPETTARCKSPARDRSAANSLREDQTGLRPRTQPKFAETASSLLRWPSLQRQIQLS